MTDSTFHRHDPDEAHCLNGKLRRYMNYIYPFQFELNELIWMQGINKIV